MTSTRPKASEKNPLIYETNIVTKYYINNLILNTNNIIKAHLVVF